MKTDSWANSPIHQMIQNFESPTPETDAAEHDIDEIPAFPFVSSNFARKLERERDEWKAKYIQQNKDLRCEMMDPNGTIWDHAEKLQANRNELLAAIRNLRDAKGLFNIEQATNQ